MKEYPSVTKPWKCIKELDSFFSFTDLAVVYLSWTPARRTEWRRLLICCCCSAPLFRWKWLKPMVENVKSQEDLIKSVQGRSKTRI
jgi:hypothetical protein